MSDFTVSLSVKANAADDTGHFDGVMDTFEYDATRQKWRVKDGETGLIRTGDIDASRKGQLPFANLKLDLDQDGISDPYAVVAMPNGDTALVASTRFKVTDGADLNGDGTADPMAPVTAPKDNIKFVLNKQFGNSASPSVAVFGGDATAFKGRAVAYGQPHFGVDLSARDLSVKPGDDFYNYANGTFLKTYPLPANKTDTGAFTYLYEASQEQVQNIILDAAAGKVKSPDAQKIADYYNSYLDEAAIDAKGLAPFTSDLAALTSFKDHTELAATFARSNLYGFDEPLGMSGWRDLKNPMQKTVYVGLSGLGMGDRDFYLSEGDEFKAIRDGYQTYVTRLLELNGTPNGAEEAKKVIALETEFAKLHWNDADSRDPTKTYNPMSYDEMKAFAPEFDWDAMIAASGLPKQDRYVLSEKSSIPAAAKLIKDTPIETWKSYMAFQYLNANRRVMPKDVRDAGFAFYGTVMSGMTQQPERWRGAVAQTNGALGEVIGKEYVARHFSAEAKAGMQDLVGNLLAVYDETLKADPNLSDETRQKALTKLHAIKTKLGYPDKWDDYSKLDIVNGDAAGNAKRLRQFNWDKSREEFAKPVDVTDWPYPPQTVNASYSPQNNDITFPAGILQPPFYDPYADPAVNYGAIGAIIGHEISHGFDDKGSKYNDQGQLQNWWTPQDRKGFDGRTGKLADFADDYKNLDVLSDAGVFGPVKNLKINGKFTLGENTADLVGLKVAYQAYRKSLNGVEPPVIDGLTGDQRFFMGWAQAYKGITREGALRNQLNTDPHAPEEFRVNATMPQLDAWYDAFDVNRRDDMYRKPKKRINIWGE
jgi:predicted metalloendopeptidase